MSDEMNTDADYQQHVKTEGFVAATAAAVTQVLANKAKIEGLEAVIADLTKRVAKLEKDKAPKK